MIYYVFIMIGGVYLGPEFVKNLRQRQNRSDLILMCAFLNV